MESHTLALYPTCTSHSLAPRESIGQKGTANMGLKWIETVVVHGFVVSKLLDLVLD